MKGIILAGGTGSRLHPLTIGTSKQLLPVYDKPMIYYPLSTLMLAGIQEVLVICTESDLTSFQRLLRDGKHIGINISYVVQEKPDGIAQAFILGRDFVGEDSVCLILGDNIFYGQNFSSKLKLAATLDSGAIVFAYQVNDPHRFGVVEFDDTKTAVSIEEKPVRPKSSYAVTGLYFYDNDVLAIASSLSPSSRGELEITDINKAYLNRKTLSVELLGRGFTWLDTGTHESLIRASQFVETVENGQGFKIGCPEEIAYNNGWIDLSALKESAARFSKSSYGQYLAKLVED